MSIQTHFDKFHDKIKLSREDDAYKKARDRDDSIKTEVKTAFSEAGYPVIADFIQGSLKTHTGDCADLGRLRHRQGPGDRRGKGTGEPGCAEEEGTGRP